MGFRIESSLTNLNGKPSLAPPPIVVVRNCCFRNTFSSKLTFYPLLLTFKYKRPLFTPFWVSSPSTPILGDHRYLFFGSIIGFHFLDHPYLGSGDRKVFIGCALLSRVNWILLLGDGITIPRLDLAVKMLTMVERIRIGAADIWRRRTRPAHIQIRPASAACC